MTFQYINILYIYIHKNRLKLTTVTEHNISVNIVKVIIVLTDVLRYNHDRYRGFSKQ